MNRAAVLARPAVRPHPMRRWAMRGWAGDGSSLAADLRFFLASWAGGLVFFGVLFA